jgi:hypothetical protein
MFKIEIYKTSEILIEANSDSEREFLEEPASGKYDELIFSDTFQ